MVYSNLGTDIKFDFNLMDVPFSQTNNFELASNENNLVNAVLHRIFTKIGELPAHPSYGSNLWNIVGKPQTKETLGEAALYIQEVLDQEDRIEEINDIELSWGRKELITYLKIKIVVTPSNSISPITVLVDYQV